MDGIDSDQKLSNQVGSAVNSDSSRLSVNIVVTTPDSVTTGRLFTIEGRVKFSSDFDGDPERITVSLEFRVDGKQIETLEFGLTEGNAKTRTQEYTLLTTGSHDVTITATATIDGSEHTDSDIKTIDASSYDTALNSATGAAFAVPDSMTDEVNSYRQNFYVDSKDLPYAFVFARPNEVYLVFCTTEPTPGEAVLSGAKLVNAKTAGVLTDITFGVVVATDVTFETTGDPVTVSDVASSPSSYEYDLVRIDDHHERVSTLYDPDSGNDVTVASTLGVLKETTTSTALDEPGRKSRDLSINVREQVGDLRQKLNGFIKQQEPSLTTFNVVENYWTASNAIVDAIVLPSESCAREFLAAFDQPGVTADSNGEPLLYVVQSSYNTTTYDSVSALKSGASDGDLVEVTADSYGLEVSAQESIEHSGTACSEDRVEVQTPTGPLCVNLVQDVLFEAGVCWTTLPTNREESLFVVGMSSRHLDEPYRKTSGNYTLIGEVVSTTRFDSSLPEAKLLVVYGRTRNGDIDYGALAEDAKDIIEDQTGQLVGAVQKQLQALAGGVTDSWSFDTGHRLQHSNVGFDGSSVYLGGLGPTVYALDKATGSVEWSFERGGSLADSSPVIDSGVLVIGAGDGRIHGINSDDGSTLWVVKTGSAVVSSPTLANGTVFIGNNRGTLYAIDRDTGNMEWSTEIGGAIHSDPLVESGYVYVTSIDGQITAVDAWSGDVQWQRDVDDGFGTLPPTTDGTDLFVAGDDLHALTTGGRLKWSTSMDGTVTSDPVVWNGLIYVGTNAGSVHAVNADGTMRWSTEIGATGRTTVNIDNGLVFATTPGSVVLLDALVGSTVVSSSVNGIVYAAPIIRDGTAYVLSGERLTALDLAS